MYVWSCHFFANKNLSKKSHCPLDKVHCLNPPYFTRVVLAIPSLTILSSYKTTYTL